MEVFMRKALATATIGLFLASGLAVTPAQAATYNKKIVNGVSCTKLNASVKGKGNETYKCANNPYLSKTKKTWTWIECLNAQKSYIQFKKDHAALVASGASATELAGDQDFLDGWLDSTKEACKKNV